MNKNEYKREARKLRDDAVAKHLHVCEIAGKELSKGLFANIIEDVIPYLVENETYISEMENACRFCFRDSAALVRNSWAMCEVDYKHILDNIEKIRKYLIF